MRALTVPVVFTCIALSLGACSDTRSTDRRASANGNGDASVSAADEYDASRHGVPDVAESDDPAIPLTAQSFVDKAASNAFWEVESSQLVIDRQISDTTLLAFARQMVVDHHEANERLKQICQTKRLSIPSGMLARHERQLDELRSRSGAEFESLYRAQQIDAHRKAIALFERAERQVEDPELGAFATQTLPMLRRHLLTLTGERQL